MVKDYKKIPITLITGFLGSGKSTFINKILNEKKNVKFGVILNEFGDVSLESQIVEVSSEDVVELQNGCMCCVSRDDIKGAIDKILSTQKDVDHILIEASGLSDPLPILYSLSNLDLSDDFGAKLNLETNICMLDVLNFEIFLKDFMTAFKQIEFANFIILTKYIEADSSKIDDVNKIIKTLNNKPRVFRFEEINLDELIDCSNIDYHDFDELAENFDLDVVDDSCNISIPGNGGSSSNASSSSNNIGALNKSSSNDFMPKGVHEYFDHVFFKSLDPLKYNLLKEFMEFYPSEIIRIKGVVHLAGKYSHLKVLLQCVGAKKNAILSSWKEGERKITGIVIIGKKLNKEKLLRHLESCVFKE